MRPLRKHLFFLILAVASVSGCRRNPKLEKLVSPDSAVRSAEILRLRDASDQAKQDLLPELISALQNQDSTVVEHAVEALTVLGPVAIPAVTAALRSPDVYVRMSAAEILGRIGFPTQDALAELNHALSDPHPLVREEAAIALKKISHISGA